MSASPVPASGKTPPPLTACGFSHPGRQREDNEDAFGSFVDERLFVIADGMGGHNAGEVASVLGDTQLAIAHAGDSRAYRLRGGELERLTRDHSLLEEMKVARPEMTEAEMAAFAHRNVVTRCLGSKDDVDPDLFVDTLQEGDIFLLCSDGLWGSVPDEKIAAIIRSTQDIEAACQLLIDAANEAGGPDNISTVLVRAG